MLVPRQALAVVDVVRCKAMEFTREWRRSCVTLSARAEYLAMMPAEVEWWAGCFKVGIDVPILAEILDSWSSSFDQEQASTDEVDGGGRLAYRVAAGLLGLSMTERYELTLSLL